jgi:hypothetical protein
MATPLDTLTERITFAIDVGCGGGINQSYPIFELTHRCNLISI